MAAELDPSSFETARRMMVDRQVRPSDVTRPALIDAMSAVPREAFVPKARRAMAYVGERIEIAENRYELDPRVFAKLVDAVDPGAEDLALVVGAGHGYAAAVLSRMCGAVIALESDPDLAAAAKTALVEGGYDNVILVEGALSAGCAEHAPYNVILVNGAAAPDALGPIEGQLAEGGRLASIRMDGMAGVCEVRMRSGGAIGRRPAFDAGAAPLPGLSMTEGFVF